MLAEIAAGRTRLQRQRRLIELGLHAGIEDAAFLQPLQLPEAQPHLHADRDDDQDRGDAPLAREECFEHE